MIYLELSLVFFLRFELNYDLFFLCSCAANSGWWRICDYCLCLLCFLLGIGLLGFVSGIFCPLCVFPVFSCVHPSMRKNVSNYKRDRASRMAVMQLSRVFGKDSLLQYK